MKNMLFVQNVEVNFLYLVQRWYLYAQSVQALYMVTRIVTIFLKMADVYTVIGMAVEVTI